MSVVLIPVFGTMGCSQEYLDRQDERMYERHRKRKSWSDRMDDRYNSWWDSIMGS